MYRAVGIFGKLVNAGSKYACTVINYTEIVQSSTICIGLVYNQVFIVQDFCTCLISALADDVLFFAGFSRQTQSLH